MSETDLQLGGGFKYQWECAILLALNYFLDPVAYDASLFELVSDFLGQVAKIHLEGESSEGGVELEDINLVSGDRRILIQVKTKREKGKQWTVTDPLLHKALYRFFSNPFLTQEPDRTRFVFLTNRPFNPALEAVRSAIKERTLEECEEVDRLYQSLARYARKEKGRSLDADRFREMLARTALVEYLALDEVKANVQAKLQAYGRTDWQEAHARLFEFFVDQSTRVGGGTVTHASIVDLLGPPTGGVGRDRITTYIHKLVLNIAKPTASEPEPGWHPVGSAWLALGLVGVILVMGLVYLMLYDFPALRETASFMVGAVVFVLGLMGLREDRRFFQRLSHFFSQARAAQVGTAALLVVSLLLWSFVGRPKLVAVMCGPLGCKPSGVRRYSLAQFDNRSPRATELGKQWTDGTRDALIQKLGQVEQLQFITVDIPVASERVNRELDYWVEGWFEMSDRALLTSRVSGRGGLYLPPDVEVQGEPSDTLANIASMRSELALALLPRLGIEVDAALEETVRSTPTDSPQAMELNNEGVSLASRGDYAAAEAKFRAALKLDPDYSVGYANLADVLASQGRQKAAVSAYKAAIEHLPNYAPFHYNLGNLYSLLGRADEATLALEEALRLDPAYVQARNELGNVFIQQGKWEGARQELERARDLDWSFAASHKNLGRVAIEQGHADRAIESLRTAISLYEEKPVEATYLLAEAYAKAGKEAEACRQISAYWDLDPHGISEWAPATRSLAERIRCP
jgi:tetratricopeptide (TPR) repeat protein